MFYVSSINKDRTLGVTDTKDGVEEILTREQILEYRSKYRIFIYGANYVNNNRGLEPKVIDFNSELSYKMYWYIDRLFHDGKNLECGSNFANYFAGLKIGEIIYVTYSDSSGKEFENKITKIDWDSWLLEDDNDVDNNKKFSNRGLVNKLVSMTGYVKLEEVNY